MSVSMGKHVSLAHVSMPVSMGNHVSFYGQSCQSLWASISVYKGKLVSLYGNHDNLVEEGQPSELFER